jgi:hypothetical protein
MKFILFIAITVSLWYAMRWMQQAEATRRARQQRSAAAPRARKTIQATDMTRCARCGTYVPVNLLSACGRADCPILVR